MPTFAHEIDDGPVIFPLLDVFNLEVDQFRSS
jgi:hypothetical protein